MIKDNSNYYFRFPDEIDDRLDFSHYHPELDDLNILNRLTPYDVKNFGTIIEDIFSGRTPKDIEYLNEGFMFLGARNIKREHLDLDNVEYIDSHYHNEILSSSKLKKLDILITMAGTIGRCCIYDIDEESNINQAIASVRLKKEFDILEKYISEYLNSKYGQMGFKKHMHEVSQPNINLDEIKRLKLIVPPTNIQKSITDQIEPIELEAHDLEDKFHFSIEKANEIILNELNIQINENLEYFFKKGTQSKSDYYYIFNEDGRDRLHYLFSHPKYTILKSLQNQYKTVLLKHICKEPIKRGIQPKYDDTGMMVIKTVDLKNRYIDYKYSLNVSEEFFEAKKEAHTQERDLLIASTGQGSLGKVDIFDINQPAMVDGHVSIIRLNDEYDPYFIAYYLRSPFGQIQFEKWFSGSSGQIEIQPRDLGNFIIPSEEDIPLEKQTEISNKITEEYNKATKYEKESEIKWIESSALFDNLITNEY